MEIIGRGEVFLTVTMPKNKGTLKLITGFTLQERGVKIEGEVKMRQKVESESLFLRSMVKSTARYRRC